jgi:hypothetical protein
MHYCFSNQHWLAFGDGCHSWLLEPLEVCKTYANSIPVRAHGERDEVASNAGIHDDRQLAGIPKGRHGAELTIGEKR